MSKWVGVVQHDFATGTRIGETLVNLDNVAFIGVTTDTISFIDGLLIKINRESTKMLLDEISEVEHE